MTKKLTSLLATLTVALVAGFAYLQYNAGEATVASRRIFI